jgi:Transposase
LRKDQTMKRKRQTEEQIIAILKEHEAGFKTADLCRKHGISPGWGGAPLSVGAVAGGTLLAR